MNGDIAVLDRMSQIAYDLRFWLNTCGVQIKYTQVMELMVTMFGYRTYAAFKTSPVLPKSLTNLDMIRAEIRCEKLGLSASTARTMQRWLNKNIFLVDNIVNNK